MKKTPATTKVMTSAANSADSTELVLITSAEPRVDSRLLAKQLGIQHPNLFAQVKTHKADFEEFGKVTFQTEPLPSGEAEVA